MFKRAINGFNGSIPSKINSQFNKLYEEDPEIATQYFFELSQKQIILKQEILQKH